MINQKRKEEKNVHIMNTYQLKNYKFKIHNKNIFFKYTYIF